MKEINYKFDTRGTYLTNDIPTFDADSHLKIIVEPHNFKFELSGEVLRSSSCSGYTIIASNKGEVCFYDNNANLIAKADETENEYTRVNFKWTQNKLFLSFVRVVIVDYYPHCDGEHDRYGESLVTDRSVTLDLTNNSIEIE